LMIETVRGKMKQKTPFWAKSFFVVQTSYG